LTEQGRVERSAAFAVGAFEKPVGHGSGMGPPSVVEPTQRNIFLASYMLLPEINSGARPQLLP